MIHRFRLFGLIAIVAASVGCGDNGTAPSTVERLDGSWRLLAFESSTGAVDTIQETDRYTASFDTEGRVNLLADCNRCFGSFTTSGVALETGPMGCTRAACPAESRSDEFIAAMDGASSYLRSGSQLFIYYDGGRLRLEQN